MKAFWIPECKCSPPGNFHDNNFFNVTIGEVRPNVLMFHDDEFNTKRADA
jgi:hypothetical protein